MQDQVQDHVQDLNQVVKEKQEHKLLVKEKEREKRYTFVVFVCVSIFLGIVSNHFLTGIFVVFSLCDSKKLVSPT